MPLSKNYNEDDEDDDDNDEQGDDVTYRDHCVCSSPTRIEDWVVSMVLMFYSFKAAIYILQQAVVQYVLAAKKHQLLQKLRVPSRRGSLQKS